MSLGQEDTTLRFNDVTHSSLGSLQGELLDGGVMPHSGGLQTPAVGRDVSSEGNLDHLPDV